MKGILIWSILVIILKSSQTLKGRHLPQPANKGPIGCRNEGGPYDEQG